MQRFLRRATPVVARSMVARSAAPMMMARPMAAAGLVTPMRFASLSQEMANELAEEEAREDKAACPATPADWAVEHDPKDAFFTLKRTYGDETLQVYCQLQVTDPELAEKGEEQTTTEHFPFTLIVNRNGKALDFTLTHIEGELVIDGVAHHDSQKLAADMSAEGFTRKERSYQGPGISELSEPVVDSIAQYLEDRGLGDDFAVFLAAYSYWTEQEHYQNWLRQVCDFTK